MVSSKECCGRTCDLLLSLIIIVVSLFTHYLMNYENRYGESFPVSDEVLDSSFCLPIGKAKVCLLCCFISKHRKLS